VTLADLLITSLVLPASSVAILAQIEDSENLCRFQYGIVTMSCVTAAIFTAVVGVENFLRLRMRKRLEQARQRHQAVVQSGTLMSSAPIISPPETTSLCSQFQVTLLNAFVWFLSGMVVLIHFFFMPQLMYSICGTSGSGPINDQLLLDSIVVLGVLLLTFASLGGLGFLKCVCIMRAWDKPMPYVTAREFALIYSNFWNWLVRFLIWCPSIVAAILTQVEKSSSHSQSPYQPMSVRSNSHGISPTITTTIITSESSIYTTVATTPSPDEVIHETFQKLLVWPALLPSCLSSLIYAIANKDFRRCYVNLFNYCCCKTSVALTRRPRENLQAGSDVRVHIIPGYNIYSSSTGHCSEVAATPPRFSSFKCGPLMNYNRRDVYEL
jgi:hypothetical protein